MPSTAPRRVRHIGVVAFDGVAATDLAGVLDAFHVANDVGPDDAGARYATHVVGLSSASFMSESGLRILPDVSLVDARPFDTIFVPGGRGLRQPRTAAAVAAWLRERAPGTRRLVSVCTGLYGLAASGPMERRRATTHRSHAADARRFPAVRIDPDASFVKDGPFHSAAGTTAGIELALALIDEDHGSDVALATARAMAVLGKRSHGQRDDPEPSRLHARAGDRFTDLVDEIAAHLEDDWTVDRMAERTCLGTRHFTRRFRARFDASPAAYLEGLRLDEARIRLAAGCASPDRIAAAIGFRDGGALRRAFERRFGAMPDDDRRRSGPDDALAAETVRPGAA